VSNEDQKHVWTWADQISTYTFWGLVIFFLFSFSAFLYFNTTYFRFSDVLGVPAAKLGISFSIFGIAGLFGLLVGWIVIEFGNVRNSLIVLAIIQVIGCYLLLNYTGKNYILQYIGAGLWGIGYSSIFVIIPSVIAGGKAGMRVFAGLYVIILVYERIQSFTVPFVAAGILTRLVEIPGYGETGLLMFKTVSITQVITGLIFLVFINKSLFEGVPKERLKPHTAYRQDAVLTFLLNLIPIYALYFIYKIHGDLAGFIRSPKLLSKRGAFWITFLFSVTLPITTTTFYDVIGEYAGSRNIRTYKKWLILLFTIILFPVAAALIQSDLNKLVADKG
jgi:hypothetical protein